MRRIRRIIMIQWKQVWVTRLFLLILSRKKEDKFSKSKHYESLVGNFVLEIDLTCFHSQPQDTFAWSCFAMLDSACEQRSFVFVKLAGVHSGVHFQKCPGLLPSFYDYCFFLLNFLSLLKEHALGSPINTLVLTLRCCCRSGCCK